MEFLTCGAMEGDVELDELIQAVVDAQLDEAQLLRLEGLLQSDETVRDIYLQYCQLESDLHRLLSGATPRSFDAASSRTKAAEERGDAICPDG